MAWTTLGLQRIPNFRCFFRKLPPGLMFSGERKCDLFFSGMFVLDEQQRWSISKFSVAFSTEGEPGQRSSHWTRKSQRKAGSASCVHPHTDSVDPPLRSAACGKLKNDSKVWISLVPASCTVTQRALKMAMLSTCFCSCRPIEWACPDPNAVDLPAIWGLI